MTQMQMGHVREISNPVTDGASELVVVKVNILQLRQVVNLFGDASEEHVFR